MQGNQDVKAQLNTVLKIKLTAINQFFLHARMCKNWGLDRLNGYEYSYSIKLMKQADKIIERIFFLEGLPNLQDLGSLLIGEDVPEILANDLTLTSDMAESLRGAIALSENQQDYVTRDLFRDLLEETEEQIDWIESQQWLIQESGLQNFLQSMM
ncbi:bacterioferritin [Cyanobacterium sp. IPPAS B-1200]|uniref:bacterioferritin n=1 Tax=Cyanobacterium sp. IPPAS B-1200 TaxID=1562720 RepID=UPI0008525656|nr:bacterioferritin [Cyanobacterium sp. IPPAS B-1200]OEJ77994.1 bacterioferritin [Cyanobacterium sp. IPPAS B-1200]